MKIKGISETAFASQVEDLELLPTAKYHLTDSLTKAHIKKLEGQVKRLKGRIEYLEGSRSEN